MDIFSFCNWPMVLAAWIIPFILGTLFSWGFLRKHKKNYEECLDNNKALTNQINDLESKINKADSSEKQVIAELDLIRSELKDKAAANAQLKSDLKKCQTEKEELLKQKIKSEEAENDSKKDEVKPESSAKPIFIDDKTKIDESESLPEQERVMSAISEASLSRVDEIVEKIEAKKLKNKKNKEKIKNQADQETTSGNHDDFTKIHELSDKDQAILNSEGIHSYEELFLGNRQEIMSFFNQKGIDIDAEKIKRWQNQAQLATNDLWDAFDKLKQIYIEQDL